MVKRIIIAFVCCLLLSSLVIAADKKMQQKPQRNLEVNSVTTPVASEQRVALVIGNSAYTHSPLKNPSNDAKDIAAKLRGLGFDVIERNNLQTKQIGSTLREFRSKLVPGSVALVFYAGHGLQIKGENYLPAVDADINSEEDVPNQSLAVKQIMDVLDEAKSRLNLVFLDACRNNPYARSFRSADRGLARISAPSGTLISYATKPGSVAADGDGRNGLYTSKLLAQMDSNQQVEQTLKRVVTEVKAASQGKQEPWMEGSIEGDFCFAGCNAGTPVQVATFKPEAIAADPSALELEAWNIAEKLDTLEGYQAYLADFANGRHAKFANAAMNKLKTPAQAAPAIQAAIPPAATTSPSQSFKDCPDCPEMVPIPGKSYAIGKYEVTQGQWRTIIGNNPSYSKSCGNICPVELVSWNNVQEFVKKLSAKTGKQYRLPTEAEWEYACRAGVQQEYCGSDNVESVAWHNGNSGHTIHPVGQKQPNLWGIFDMNGNVWEWVQDCWEGDCTGSGQSGQSMRVIRGGSWDSGPQPVHERGGGGPTYRFNDYGFRLARTLP